MMLSKMPKRISKTISAGWKKLVPASVPHEPWLIERLKDPEEAAAYLEAAIEDGDQGVLMLALRHIAQARGVVAAIARKSKLTARGNLPDALKIRKSRTA
jgi:hypothetical protein